MNRIPTLWTFLLCLGIPAVQAKAAHPEPDPARRPNILFLFADDQRPDTIGAWGNPHIQTPNLDALTSEGFSFKANYCFGGNSGAVCIPSRAMLMGGRTWFRVDHALSNAITFPELFGRAGYRTFATGKWHNGQASFLRSFGEARSVHFGGMDDHTRVAIQDLKPDGTFTDARPSPRFSSEEFADRAIGFLESASPDQPFLAYVAFTAPHDPRNPPPEWRDAYYAARPPLPRNYLPQHPFDNGHLVLRDEDLLPWPRPPEQLSDQIAEYYGLVSHLDEQVGRILAALAASPHAHNTYVVYAADHGLALGSHGLLGKQNVYEHSMRCPLIITGPGIPKGQATHAFTYLLDLFPTLCQMTGVQPPDGLDGQSLVPIWTGKQAAVRDSVFLPYLNLMRAVRDERWKLIVYPQVNHRQLFDLEKDPEETLNVAGDPQHAAHVERLLLSMQAWQQAVGDAQPLSVEAPLPLVRDLTGHPRRPDRWQPAWIVEKYFDAP